MKKQFLLLGCLILMVYAAHGQDQKAPQTLKVATPEKSTIKEAKPATTVAPKTVQSEYKGTYNGEPKVIKPKATATEPK